MVVLCGKQSGNSACLANKPDGYYEYLTGSTLKKNWFCVKLGSLYFSFFVYFSFYSFFFFLFCLSCCFCSFSSKNSNLVQKDSKGQFLGGTENLVVNNR